MSSSLKPGWSYRRLDELGFVGRGRSRHRPRNAPFLYGGPYPFIQTAEITGSDLYVTSYTQTYSELGLAQSKMWQKNTLCIVNAGANTGESAILTFKACFPDSVIGFIADPEKADVRFVKYYLDTIRPQIKQITRGATQDNLSIAKLLSFEVRTPPLKVQRKIAGTLSAYDDLIENNARRIAIMEEMGRVIYREWFVRYRFPGHEQVGLVDSTLGLIPKSWEVVLLTELVDFVRGVEPGSKNYLESPSEDSIPFLRVGDFGSRRSSIFIPRALAKGRILDRRDIAITLDGTVGIVKTGLSGGYSSGIRKVVIRDGDRLYPSFLYYLLQSDHIQAIIRAHAKGTTILHAGSAINHMTFALPPASIMQTFDHFVSPLMTSMLNLQERNVLLRQTRDLLLPRLISGEVDVSELEINTGGLDQ